MQIKRSFTVVGVSTKPHSKIFQLKGDDPQERGELYFDEWSDLGSDILKDVKDGSKLKIVLTSTQEPTGRYLEVIHLKKLEVFNVGPLENEQNRTEVTTTLVLDSPPDNFIPDGVNLRLHLILGKRRSYRVFRKTIQPGTVFLVTIE